MKVAGDRRRRKREAEAELKVFNALERGGGRGGSEAVGGGGWGGCSGEEGVAERRADGVLGKRRESAEGGGVEEAGVMFVVPRHGAARSAFAGGGFGPTGREPKAARPLDHKIAGRAGSGAGLPPRNPKREQSASPSGSGSLRTTPSPAMQATAESRTPLCSEGGGGAEGGRPLTAAKQAGVGEREGDGARPHTR